MNGLFGDGGIVGHLHSRRVGQNSPAEAHLGVATAWNLPAERAADLVEHGLAALGAMIEFRLVAA